MTTTTLLPTITARGCQHITGNDRDHAAHTVYTTQMHGATVRHVPVAQCPGRHAPVTIQAPVDPFAGIAGAYDDRDL